MGQCQDAPQAPAVADPVLTRSNQHLQPAQERCPLPRTPIMRSVSESSAEVASSSSRSLGCRNTAGVDGAGGLSAEVGREERPIGSRGQAHHSSQPHPQACTQSPCCTTLALQTMRSGTPTTCASKGHPLLLAAAQPQATLANHGVIPRGEALHNGIVDVCHVGGCLHLLIAGRGAAVPAGRGRCGGRVAGWLAGWLTEWCMWPASCWHVVDKQARA